MGLKSDRVSLPITFLPMNSSGQKRILQNNLQTHLIKVTKKNKQLISKN